MTCRGEEEDVRQAEGPERRSADLRCKTVILLSAPTYRVSVFDVRFNLARDHLHSEIARCEWQYRSPTADCHEPHLDRRELVTYPPDPLGGGYDAQEKDPVLVHPFLKQSL